MVDIQVQVERLDAVRLAEKATQDTTATYTVNVSLSERERNPNSLSLNFEFELACQPQIAKISVRGATTITGTRDDIQLLLKPTDPDSPPSILITIYERVYGSIYLLARDMNLPHPMPGLMQQGGAVS
jgi:hypothetical protein